jgi:manganese/zinc/iron transport system permease protein
MGGVLLINLIFLVTFYKELKLATFDAGLAATLGFLPGVLHYALMGLVSLTAVSAFDAVGSILVVALMVGPPATAYLLTDRLALMIGLSAGVGALAAISGYWMAFALDASIAGSMATMAGVWFGLAVLGAPERGVVARYRMRRNQKWRFAEQMLAIHLLQHEDTPEADRETREAHLQEHLSWTPTFAERVVRRSTQRGTIERRNGHLALTDRGRRVAKQALERT